MTAIRRLAGRIGKKRVLATTGGLALLATLLVTTETPSALLAADGGSTALAELAARSPGARVGGVALKAKPRRAALSPVASALGPEAEATTPAAALGSPLPEGPIPTGVPGIVLPDFAAPPVPTPADAGGTAAAPGFPEFGGGLPPIAGPAIFLPPGGGGGGGGGGTGVTPNPGPTPMPTPTVPGVPPAIPEPSTWLMLIAGFGVIGGAMRRKRRVAIA